MLCTTMPENKLLLTRKQKTGSEVGRGRSGVVYFEHDNIGRPIVRKIFGGDIPSKIVLYTLTGAPNPYVWNADAIACAIARRHILSHLVTHWFGNHLKLPRTDHSSWNEAHRAFAIHCEFIQGRHIPLRLAPLRATIDGGDSILASTLDPLKDLRQNIMKPLQKRLRESGFDGLVWQAGLGNPVATNNFMLVTGDAPPAHQWVWIDLESGVPALFPANPIALLRFYLPASIKHRRPMFDDVDLPRLAHYLTTLQSESPDAFETHAWAQIHESRVLLTKHQTSWKTMSRGRRSIESARVRGKITDAQAEWFVRHRLLWLMHVMLHGVAGAVGYLVKTMRQRMSAVVRALGKILGPSLWQFVSSQRFRTRLSRRVVALRIGYYEKRNQLSVEDARQLRRELRSDASTEYITDFGIHLSFKPFIKTSQWTLVPLGVAYGMLTPVTAVLLLAFIGPVARTIYTLGRCVQASVRRQRLPVIALLVGMLPSVGTLAYPAQLAWAAEVAGHRHRLARFIIDDTFASLGRKLPVWGGPDTLTEHFFNRLPSWLAGWLSRGRRRERGALRVDAK